jgi:hypothetical protein
MAAGYTAFNVFGSESRLHWITWFRQDEYTGSVSATEKIPRDDPMNMTSLYTGYLQANFYMTDTDSLRTGGEFSFEADSDWDVKLTLAWKRRGSMSPLLGAFLLFKPDSDISGVILTRTDSINCTVSEVSSTSSTSSEITKKQSFDFNHVLDMQITKYLTITGSIEETYACTWGTSILLTASASIGATIRF